MNLTFSRLFNNVHLGSESWPSSLQPCPLAFQRNERGGLDNTISDELMSEREGSKEWRERWMDGWMDGGRGGGRKGEVHLTFSRLS